MKRETLFILLLALSRPGEAQQPPENPEAGINQAPKLSVENINRQTEILNNPGVAVDNARQALSGQSEPGVNPPPPGPAKLSESPEHITDPTQMTGSFSQALNRINAKPGQSSAPGQVGPSLPEISLVAKSIHHQDKRAAILNVGGKTRMVKPGGKFTYLSNNVLYEIHVNKIERDHVEITVLPMSRQMILE